MSPGGGAAIDLGSGADSKSLRALIQKSIHETAAQGDVVIVSHAASYALSGSDDVLRVLVTASPETRADRTGEAASLDSKKAAKVVADSDAARAAYLKRFYGVGEFVDRHTTRLRRLLQNLFVDQSVAQAVGHHPTHGLAPRTD